MAEFPPIRTIEEFSTLDEADILIGYLEAFAGSPEPSSSCSRSYCHGWRKGMIDIGCLDADCADRALDCELRQATCRRLH